MHTLLAVGVTILTATAQPQPTLTVTQPLTVTFVTPVTFEDTISFLAKTSKVTIEMDSTVSMDVRRQALAEYAISLRDVTLEEAIAQLTRIKGLAYSVIDDHTIRIFKKV